MKKIYHFIFLIIITPVTVIAQDTAIVSDVTFDTLPAPVHVQEEAHSYKQSGENDEGKSVEDERIFTLLTIARKDSFRLRKIDPTIVRAQQQDEAFWYANYPFKKDTPVQQENVRKPLIAHPAFETIMWIVVIGGFITFLAIFLMNNNAGIFRRSKTIRDIPEGGDFDDIFSINYQQEIGKAIAAGDHNFAVRLLYLRLLSKMAERNIIEYKQDRTNLDYLMQLHKTTYYAAFFKLTRHYEFAWYGQFPVDREKYELIRTTFENFERNLN